VATNGLYSEFVARKNKYQEEKMKKQYLRLEFELIEFTTKEVLSESDFKDGTGFDPYSDALFV